MKIHPAIQLKFVVCSLCLAICVSLSAQDIREFEQFMKGINDSFTTTKSEYTTDFESFRKRINNEFADYLARQWEKMPVQPPVPSPSKPEPEPIVDNTPASNSRPLPFVVPSLDIRESLSQPKPLGEIAAKSADPAALLPDLGNILKNTVPVPEKPKDPVVNIPEKPVKEEPSEPEVEENFVSFSYLGNSCRVRVPADKNIIVNNGTNKSIAEAWKVLAGEEFNSILVDCLCIRRSLKLCDWAFYQFVCAFTEALYGNDSCNEAAVMQAYVLTQLGYKVRLAKYKSFVAPLLAFDNSIYFAPYTIIGNDKFYCFSKKFGEESFQVCNFKFPEEQSLSTRMAGIPVAPESKNPSRVVVSKRYPSVKATVSTNKNLIGFYDTYPTCSWEFFAAASLSDDVKAQLYPSLKKAVAGKTEVEAANMLINFVQTGFEYQTDEEQFGREKSFFGDEAFFYPYCDCEDRSILYSILVKDILGLDVVLLEYPTHVATAVKFNKEVVGDYCNINGAKYVICDPTYIGAPIGKSMPDMLISSAVIHSIR